MHEHCSWRLFQLTCTYNTPAVYVYCADKDCSYMLVAILPAAQHWTLRSLQQARSPICKESAAQLVALRLPASILNPAYKEQTTDSTHALQIERRYGSQGLHATSVMPGGIMTELGRHMDPSLMEKFMTPELKKTMKSPEQGAATTVWAAIGRDWEANGGKYLNDCAVAEPHQQGQINLGYAPHAYDEEAAKKLWEVSLQLVELQ